MEYTEEERKLLSKLGKMGAEKAGFKKDPELARRAQLKSVEARKRNRRLRQKNETA